jgi:hypothetical protein
VIDEIRASELIAEMIDGFTDRLDDPEDEWGRTFYGRPLEFRDQGIYADRMEEQKVSLGS